MTYSLDLRERAIKFVQSGGSQAEASRIFCITTRTLRYWMSRTELAPKICGSRRRKLDKAALAAHVIAKPDALLRERAQEFGVSGVAIFKALRKLQISKKNDPLRGKSFR